ncbi:MAG TPA: nuclear transport factor 2 family protein [Candidatus Eisenbacteria bacterium]|nr:nuclear transport factor 2 family protein [Candidatus Eisenbacteria bacterium]
MKPLNAAPPANSSLRRFALFSLVLLLAVSVAFAASDKQNKKKKKDDSSSTPNPALAVSDEQRIDTAISDMLGAWQIGDVEKLHSHYADDMDAVNGMWAPPIVGWPNYLASYEAQRARSQQVRLDRSNTLIRLAPSGNAAWACYQWEFTGLVDGNPMTAFGQTTLILEKRNDAWLIVHNHTSLVQASQVGTPAAQHPAATPPKP